MVKEAAGDAAGSSTKEPCDTALLQELKQRHVLTGRVGQVVAVVNLDNVETNRWVMR